MRAGQPVNEKPKQEQRNCILIEKRRIKKFSTAISCAKKVGSKTNGPLYIIARENSGVGQTGRTSDISDLEDGTSVKP